jgi:hypothetical protein
MRITETCFQLLSLLVSPCTASPSPGTNFSVPRHFLTAARGRGRSVHPSCRSSLHGNSNLGSSQPHLDFSATAIAHHPNVHHSCHSHKRSVPPRSVHTSTQWPLSPTREQAAGPGWHWGPVAGERQDDSDRAARCWCVLETCIREVGILLTLLQARAHKRRASRTSSAHAISYVEIVGRLARERLLA